MSTNTHLVALEEADAVLLAEDSEYRRLVFSQVTASAFGVAVLKYRLDHGLSQRALGLDIDLRIGPREEGKRPIPKALQKGVYDASDQVIVSIRER